MTNEQILKKVIKKAVKGGWKKGYSVRELTDEVTLTSDAGALAECMIFDHQFAKGFWGKRNHKMVMCEVDGKKNVYEWCETCNIMSIVGRETNVKCHDWKHHLQQLVLAEDRLKYLEKFI